MVKLKCPYCQHEWDYLGTKNRTLCGRCNKYINVKKCVISDVSKGEEEVSRPSEEGQKLVSEAMVKPAITEKGIEIQEVKVQIPEELEKAPAPEVSSAVSKHAVQAEIPYKTAETLVELPFNAWANLEKDETYKLSRTETGSLAPLVKQVLDKHMGAWFAQYSEEIAIAVVLGLIMITRISYKLKKKAEKKVPLGTEMSARSGALSENPADSWVESEKERKVGR